MLQWVVLDQAGLDLLLAHPHIVDLELLAVAGTESRVDSPCSWHTLSLPYQVDVRTLSYVPLHSLKEPLPVDGLLLPPDLPPAEAAQLLLAATTRIAQHKHLFAEDTFQHLSVTDFASIQTGLHNMEWAPGVQQPAWAPQERLALIAALEPLAGTTSSSNSTNSGGIHSSIRVLEFVCHRQPPRMEFGQPELQALGQSWGQQVERLTLKGVKLGDNFMPAVAAALPKLKHLALTKVQWSGQSLVARLMLLAQRVTGPLKIWVDEPVYK
jgi:hypothetical protein